MKLLEKTWELILRKYLEQILDYLDQRALRLPSAKRKEIVRRFNLDQLLHTNESTCEELVASIETAIRTTILTQIRKFLSGR